MLDDLKEARGYVSDADISAEDLEDLANRFKDKVKEVLGKEFPDDPREQLWGGIGAVFASWNGKRAISYRRIEGIPDDWGTAVNVQAMVFGNMGDTSATGVAFTRNPATGENKFYGEWLPNAQGEDVVAGIRTPQQVSLQGSRVWAEGQGVSEAERAEKYPSMEEAMPDMFHQFLEIVDMLEHNYQDMQDMEFTIERGKLWMLQTRTGKRTAAAAVKIAADLVDEGMIDAETALMRVEPEYVDLLLRPSFDPAAKAEAIAKGLNASPGAAVGVAICLLKRQRFGLAGGLIAYAFMVRVFPGGFLVGPAVVFVRHFLEKRDIRWFLRLATGFGIGVVLCLAAGSLGAPALRAMLRNLYSGVFVHHGGASAKDRFRERHGQTPGDFLVISPGKACNLRCEGCYANSGAHKEKLARPVFERLVGEAHREWGTRVFIISGGEPLAYRSEGKGALDLAARFPDCFFVMYTNGTLIDDRTAKRMGELGNLSPALSVEGMREKTDARRGDGVFDKVLAAMERLKREGVITGISLTATRKNAEEILSDAYGGVPPKAESAGS